LGNEKQVLVLGAGFAGLYTALHLQEVLGKDSRAQITLVDWNHYHLFTPLLHEALSGVLHPGLILTPIRRILHGTDVEFLRARVEQIDLETRNVSLCCAIAPYDILVIGLGSVTAYYGLDSVRDVALELKTADDVDTLHCHIINRFEAASREQDPDRRRQLLTFAVVGGGCTGVETVAEVHEFVTSLRKEQYDAIGPAELRTVLVELQDRVLPQMDRTLSRTSVRRLKAMGVEVMLRTQVTGYEGDALTLTGGQGPLPTSTVVWTAGVRANPVLESLPLEKDRMGRIMVDSRLRTPSHPEVYVLGDAAHAVHPQTGEVYPPTAQVAYRQAPIAATNIAADLTGGSGGEFDFTYIGDLVSLGRFSGVADPFGIRLRGTLAWAMWKFYYLLTLIGWQNRLRVALNWLLALLFPAHTTMPNQCQPHCDAPFCPPQAGLER
jgi:NADH dehydrogenase